MALSSVYYIAEIEGGERVVITDSRASLKANLRFGMDRAIRVKRPRGLWLKVKEPLDISRGRHQKVIAYAVEYGKAQRNRRIAL